MEPAEAIDCLSKLSLLIDLREGGSHIAVESCHVWLDASRWLLSHLEGLLEKRDRESVNWLCRKEKSEGIFVVVLVSRDLFKLCFQIWEQRDRQMAVTQEAPFSFLCDLHKEVDSSLCLAFTKRDILYSLVVLLCELLKSFGGIYSLRKDKNDWHLRLRIIVDVCNRRCLGLNEFCALEVILYELFDSKCDSVWSEAA